MARHTYKQPFFAVYHAKTFNHNPQNEKAMYGLRYDEFVVPLVKAVQEQQIIIEDAKVKISTLEAGAGVFLQGRPARRPEPLLLPEREPQGRPCIFAG